MSNNLDEITVSDNTVPEHTVVTECVKPQQLETVIVQNMSNLSFDKDANAMGNTKQHAAKKPATDNNQKHAQDLNITNSSLNNLLVYSSSSDESEQEEENVLNVDEMESSSSSSSSDDDSISDCFNDDADVIEMPSKTLSEGKPDPPKKHEWLQDTLAQLGELSINDLPPVPLANAQVKSEECDQIGTVSSIIDKLVMVESIPNKPAYDIDTLLFLDKGKRPLGYIFEVIGPVTSPLYAIRFNSTEDISAQSITKGMPVYSAPNTEHSHYVFVQELLKQKGSDASWMDDMEVPKDFEDYSDDETEYYLGVSSKSRKRNSLERHKNFEKDMNVRNLVDTKLHRVRDSCEPRNKKPTVAAYYTPHPQQPPLQQQLQLQAQSVAHMKQRASQLPKAAAHLQPVAAAAAAAAAAHCAFRPPYALPAYATPLNPFAAQFIPNAAQLMAPPPLPPQLQALGHYATAPGPQPAAVSVPAATQMVDQLTTTVYRNIPISAAAQVARVTQAKCSQQSAVTASSTGILYPPDMGLPSHLPPPPPTQGPPTALVANIPYYAPVIWSNFGNPPPPPPPVGAATAPSVSAATPSKSYRKPRNKYYKKRPN